MNLLLHGIGDEEHESPIVVDDALKADPGERFEMVLTNPPFGTQVVDDVRERRGRGRRARTSSSCATTSGRRPRTSSSTSSSTSRRCSTINGRAAVVVPDNVLFEGGAGETVRRRLLHECDVHTLLRLPTGHLLRAGREGERALLRPQAGGGDAVDARALGLRPPHEPALHAQAEPAPLRAPRRTSSPPTRRTTARARVESERFQRFTYDELVARDKASLDITWLRDESLEDTENLPPPEVIAQEIVEDLEAALAEFAAVAESLQKEDVPAGE